MLLILRSRDAIRLPGTAACTWCTFDSVPFTDNTELSRTTTNVGGKCFYEVSLARFREDPVFDQTAKSYLRWHYKEFYATVFDLFRDFKDSLVCDLHSDVSFCFFWLWLKLSRPLQSLSASQDAGVSFVDHSPRR